MRVLFTGSLCVAIMLQSMQITFAQGDRIGPSFYFEKVKAPLAELICTTPELALLDLRFSQAYWALLHQLGEAGAKVLKAEDVSFINDVNSQCGIPTAG